MQPNLNPTISVVPHPGRLRVIWKGNVIADTTDALMLQEPPYRRLAERHCMDLRNAIPRGEADRRISRI
jgi:uncharacterized protein (DUF427 family)